MPCAVPSAVSRAWQGRGHPYHLWDKEQPHRDFHVSGRGWQDWGACPPVTFLGRAGRIHRLQVEGRAGLPTLSTERPPLSSFWLFPTKAVRTFPTYGVGRSPSRDGRQRLLR